MDRGIKKLLCPDGAVKFGEIGASLRANDPVQVSD
jgi:hypothetical protein